MRIVRVVKTVSLLVGIATSMSAQAGQGISIAPLNSPVKERTAKFEIKLSDATANISDDALFSIEPAQKDKSFNEKSWPEKPVRLERTDQGFQANIVVSALSPGQYILKLRVNPPKGLLQKAAGVLSSKENDEKDGNNLKGEAVFAVDSSLEVADPGEAGKQTLEGLDTDKNGVRDDVQRWINEMYASSAKTKAALKQLARDQQVEILSANNKQTSVAASRKMLSSLDCLDYIHGLDGSVAIRKQLDSRMLNTRARLRADVQTNINFHGQIVRAVKKEDEKQRCEFDPDSMAN